MHFYINKHFSKCNEALCSSNLLLIHHLRENAAKYLEITLQLYHADSVTEKKVSSSLL